ncbi:hypothetical protein FHS52_001718 [Erythromicrobium ramosum]|uniref:DUF4139 domain-containing protein n=1 Tax=Erythrobacter ramosus TaxID=35811 RepID=A0A6I4UNN3_9SPHN|nr:hypothetical protein [Erythrobacter ramosus]MBB3775749.1 hypothetical protein [Erythrobacter ramosus]MXP39157.1 hypothetical protein [Erythrobacter ramosus]
MRLPSLALMGAAVLAAPLWAREVIDAAPPSDIAVTIYRDPDRDVDEPLEADYPQGLAMISETRRVTLPKGESTIRFEGVAEGMIGVSAIVTGLPGGTIEKNRNAQLLSPAALVDGTLGNRVSITRMNPATGAQVSEHAVVRTRADGGLVLQTSQGFEAVQCSGLPETLTYDRVPDGLSASPVFSVDTRSPEGGTFDVTLTYLAWGFDWQADYVATMQEKGAGGEFDMGVLSWLTLVNDNGQSFDRARLQIIAGKLNVDSDYESLADPPVAEALWLTCYPLGTTSSDIAPPPPPPVMYAPEMAYPAPAMMAREDRMIVVTGSRLEAVFESPSVVTAEEEDIGDLKLFRVPERVDVSAKGMKQVAFLNKDAVKARYLYQAGNCDPWDWIKAEDAEDEDFVAATLLLVTKNEEKKGLGIALPQGAMTLYEPTSRGPQLAAQVNLRDYARGQDIELELGTSAQVFVRCGGATDKGPPKDARQWTPMRARITNANPHPITLRLQVGYAGEYDIRFPGRKVEVKNGYQTVELTVPANQTQSFDWKHREAADE